MTTCRRCLYVVAGLWLLCLVSGCSSPEGPRNEIFGKITLKKQPIEEGLIEFEPLDGQGSKSGAKIEKGEFRIPGGKGLMPGRYRVSIYAGDGIVSSGDASPEAPKIPPGAKPGVERVPKEYNAESKLVWTVKEGPNEFNFDVP